MNRLTTIKTGRAVELLMVDGGAGVVQRLADMGLLPGERIKVINNSGIGPLMVNVKGSKLVLGCGIASKLLVKEV